MANRFSSPSQQFVNSAGAPYSGGKLNFYASGTSTPLNTYSDSALSIANANPVVLDSAGRSGDIFLQVLAYKVVLTDSANAQIWTADPVSSSDYTTVAQFQTNTGSPNGNLAGTAGSGAIPSSSVWDRTNNILYICTTTGNAAAAVWTAVNAASAAAIVPTPQGYLTLTSATPIITADVTGSTAVYYTPLNGNIVPIYNGSTFTPTTFAELTMTLTSSQAASTIYDLFVFSNAGVVTIAVGPAWTTSTAAAGARGTGAGTTQLQRINGILVNAVQVTAKNSATTYTIAANQGTFVGSLFMDSAAGQVTCHRSYGQSRKWGVSNAYNRVPTILKGGDGTASWNYGTGTIRASNAAATNNATVFQCLAEEIVDVSFIQNVVGASGSTTPNSNGIGWNSTTAYTGMAGTGSTNAVQTGEWNSASRYIAAPFLGINVAQSLEKGFGGTTTFNGTELNMLLTACWRV